jgi:hypothetical protein
MEQFSIYRNGAASNERLLNYHHKRLGLDANQPGRSRQLFYAKAAHDLSSGVIQKRFVK